MKQHLPSFLILLTAILLPVEGFGRKTTLTLSPPKEKTTKQIETIVIDTTSNEKEVLSRIICAGFDKTPTSTKESLFISNHTGRNIYSVTLSITYLTRDSLVLDRRQVTVNKAIPAGETRKFDINSFDTQRSFHYFKSITSRRPTTPFDVRINVIKAISEKN